MIGKAKSISHGHNGIRYITGESRNKKHPELIYHVCDNMLPDGLDAQGVWDMMKAHAPMTKNVIRIEVSPATEHTRDFTLEDWQQLWHDFVKEYDSLEFKDKDGNIYSHKTNIAGSISTVWLHFESHSGIPHLHAVVCRKDCDGKTNNDHNIHLRAQYAAERIAEKRGWTTARNIRMAKASEIADDLTGILCAMPSWSWDDYVARVRAKGYTLMERRDKKGRMCGYTVGDGNKVYRASELGKGRKLMASKIESTWTKLHNKSAAKAQHPYDKGGLQHTAKMHTTPAEIHDRPVTDYTVWKDGTRSYEFEHDGKPFRFYLPEIVMRIFDDEFDYRETSNWRELTDFAVALFVGLTALDTVSTGSDGGSSSNDEGWRDRKDEDEIERARRCARAAAAHLGKNTKSGRNR